MVLSMKHHNYMYLYVLTREPGHLKPPDLAPVLQHDSGHLPSLMYKTLNVDIALYICNTQFYFHVCYV